MTVERVCALVVTRNRRELLARCVDALLAQTHPLSGIVVFDNASTDGTGELFAAGGPIHSPLVRYVRSEINLGGAGGYAEALRLAQRTGADWFWTTDDDAEARPDALERLLSSAPARDPGTVALCPAVVDHEGRIDSLHRCSLRRLAIPLPASAYAPGRYPHVDCASFVGLLVRASAVRSAGPPRREFFLGYDDAEYSLRLRRAGSIRLVPESVVTHDAPVGGGEITRRSRRWHRVVGARYPSSSWESYWRDLYRVRNFVALKAEHEGLTRPGLAALIAAYVGKALMYEQHPWQRIPWLIRFAIKGFRGDFGSPAPEEWVEFTRSGGSVSAAKLPPLYRTARANSIRLSNGAPPAERTDTSSKPKSSSSVRSEPRV